MQGELNKLVGRDTINDPNKYEWVNDYKLAFLMEAFELIDCVCWKWWSKEYKEGRKGEILDLENAKI